MFSLKLRQAVDRNGSLLCVGLDVDPSLAPPSLVGSNGWVERFALGIVEATADLVCAFKPNLAFYEALGLDGYLGLQRILAALPRDVVSIGDAKRGDVGNTAAAYARAMFDRWGFDAVTVAPFIGRDSIAPFAAYRDRGVLVVCKTSNPGSADFQDLPVGDGDPRATLYEAVARRVVEWNESANLGLVVGATYPDQLRRVRAIAPDLPILVPGIGPQAGDLAAAVSAGLDRAGRGMIINASRSVLYASRGDDWQAAARAAAMQLSDEIEASRSVLPLGAARAAD